VCGFLERVDSWEVKFPERFLLLSVVEEKVSGVDVLPARQCKAREKEEQSEKR